MGGEGGKKGEGSMGGRRGRGVSGGGVVAGRREESWRGKREEKGGESGERGRRGDEQPAWAPPVRLTHPYAPSRSASSSLGGTRSPKESTKHTPMSFRSCGKEKEWRRRKGNGRSEVERMWSSVSRWAVLRAEACVGRPLKQSGTGPSLCGKAWEGVLGGGGCVAPSYLCRHPQPAPAVSMQQ